MDDWDARRPGDTGRNFWQNERNFGGDRFRDTEYMDSGKARGRWPERRGPADDTDLASRSLMIQSKKFFLDIKETQRGRFFKISEKAANGAKSKLTMEMDSAQTFQDKLTEFIEVYSNLGPRNSKNTANATHKSDKIVGSDRTYHLDLKENPRGRFLKMTMTFTRPSNNEKTDIVIPAQGMVDLRDNLADLLSEFVNPVDVSGESKESKEKDDEWVTLVDRTTPSKNEVKEEKKEERKDDRPELSLSTNYGRDYLFKVGENKHGMFLRISEVSSSFRTAINIPREGWSEFLDLMKTSLKEQRNKDSQSGDADAAPIDVPPAAEAEEVSKQDEEYGANF